MRGITTLARMDRNLSTLWLALWLAGCGGKASVETGTESGGAPPSITVSGALDGSPGAGLGGAQNAGGALSSDGGEAGGGSPGSPNILLACWFDNAPPLPTCVGRPIPGVACDPSIFRLCKVAGETLMVMCGPHGYCPPPPPSPCNGPCSGRETTCLAPQQDGAVERFACCVTDGGLAWTMGRACQSGAK